MRTSLVAATLVLGLAGVMATPANGASVAVPPTGPTKLQSLNSAKCADVEAWSTNNGAAVHQWSCRLDNDANQKWTFRPSGASGYWKLVNLNSEKCLDIEGPSYADGAKIHQWDCYDTASQDWRIQDVGGEWFKLVSRHSGKCVDVEAWSKADGAKIHQWSCRDSNDANQRWRFVG
ncbi:RICIN domain-containing protein [Streptomyces sp. NBC_01565]|uniref:RICIN domain-containing protein n=1 Tax=unclassified Streptomyces TaxID=2593676 RepID=UPI00225737B8|nr:RICIN domain-containing protein [Streptomyces sp. NBC_01565]MCX4539466.1 RICIN domain-containing protein [Streptomyces sp. NBC_01565]